MTPGEHYQEAERLLHKVDNGEAGDTMLSVDQLTALAQVHATLATVPAELPVTVKVVWPDERPKPGPR